MISGTAHSFTFFILTLQQNVTQTYENNNSHTGSHKG